MKTTLVLTLLVLLVASCKPSSPSSYRRVPVESVVVELLENPNGGGQSTCLEWAPGWVPGPAETSTVTYDDPVKPARMVTYNYVGPVELSGPSGRPFVGSMFAFRIVRFMPNTKATVSDQTITCLYSGTDTNAFESDFLTIRIRKDDRQRYMILMVNEKMPTNGWSLLPDGTPSGRSSP